MVANRRNERLKQLVQVLIDKKNSGKQVGSIAKMANMGMKDFKNISYKFKVDLSSLFANVLIYVFRRFSG